MFGGADLLMAAGGGISDTISQIALPGGIASMVAVILVTLIRTRSTDRSQLSTEQKEHMDRLTKERNDLADDLHECQVALDAERALRIHAENSAATANLAQLRMSSEVQLLRGQVLELQTQVQRLTAQVTTLTSGPTSP